MITEAASKRTFFVLAYTGAPATVFLELWPVGLMM
jgi:hypothetical protein